MKSGVRRLPLVVPMCHAARCTVYNAYAPWIRLSLAAASKAALVSTWRRCCTGCCCSAALVAPLLGPQVTVGWQGKRAISWLACIMQLAGRLWLLGTVGIPHWGTVHAQLVCVRQSIPPACGTELGTAKLHAGALAMHMGSATLHRRQVHI